MIFGLGAVVGKSWALAILLGAMGPAPALAQEAPVPSEPDEDKKEAVTPGFDDKPARDAAKDRGDEKPKKRRGRDMGDREPPLDPYKPVDVPAQSSADRLVADMVEASGQVTLGELVDEILADVMAEIDQRPANIWSPMALRQVALGANVNQSFSRKLQAAIIAQVHAGTEIRMIECVECETTKTRLEDDQWVITRGIATTEDMRRVADTIGVKAFMDVAFGFDPENGVMEMDFRIIRARDSFVMWSDSFRADETTPVIARSSEVPMKRRDRLRDLEMLLEGRPYYGIAAAAGFMIIPHNDPVDGDISGATAGFRVYERFGVERRVMFGLDLTGFINTTRLAGAVISAGSWWIPIRPDFVNPELRLGAKAGAFIAGTSGNAAAFQLGAELLLRYRFGLYAYVMFMTKSEYPPDSGTELGGVGMSTGMSFNW